VVVREELEQRRCRRLEGPVGGGDDHELKRDRRLGGDGRHPPRRRAQCQRRRQAHTGAVSDKLDAVGEGVALAADPALEADRLAGGVDARAKRRVGQVLDEVALGERGEAHPAATRQWIVCRDREHEFFGARSSPVLLLAHARVVTYAPRKAVAALPDCGRQGSKMDLNQYVGVLRAHWFLVIASVVACTLGAGSLGWTRTPTYAARTQLFVSTSGVGADLSQTYQGGLFAQQRVQSYAQMVSSPAVAHGVITQLGLRESVPQLQAKIQASVPTDTVLLNVTVRDRSQQRAAAIANAVGEHFSAFVNRLESPRGERRSPVKVSVTSPAGVPSHPISPRKALYLGLGGLMGLILGIGGAVLREALDKRIRREHDAATIARAPVLGSIADDPEADRRPLIMVTDPASVAAEAYRRLRTNLRVLTASDGVRSFVVSSAVVSEGKTLVAANLGIAFAQGGLRVVLVDADMRRPMLADVLGVSSTVGLSTVLADDVPVEAALQTWRDGLPLDVLPSGWQPSDPGDLLASPRLAAVLDALTDRADVVILDAPALQLAADAAILARLTSGAILVTRVASTRAEQLRTAARSLRAVDGQILGVVLNRQPSRNARRYGPSAPAPDREIVARREFAPDVAAGTKA
jgi:succinoglycan biosynthesis transport protein ExoP